MKSKILLLALCLCFACVSKTSMSLQDLTVIHDIWALTDLKDFDRNVLDSISNIPTLEINSTDLKYHGFSGCNQFSGKITYDKDSIKLLPGPMTRAFCNDNNLESMLMSAILSTNRFERKEKTLFLYKDEDKLCSFRKVD